MRTLLTVTGTYWVLKKEIKHKQGVLLEQSNQNWGGVILHNAAQSDVPRKFYNNTS